MPKLLLRSQRKPSKTSSKVLSSKSKPMVSGRVKLKPPKRVQLQPGDLKTISGTRIKLIWSKSGWDDISRENGYIYPPPVPYLPGENFVEQLCQILERYILDCETLLNGFPVKATTEEKILGITAKTYAVLDDAQKAIQDAVALASDIHQYVHIHEVSNNALRTIIVVCDRILGYPEQPSSVTRPKEETILLHPELCGLLECDHILSPASTHQGPRIPYSPHRTGREITYEEIANLYRTSRVSIRHLEVDKCRPKLKAHLKDFR